MQKAIIIIEVGDNTDFTKARADITMKEQWGVTLGNPGRKWIQNVELRPMPEKYEQYLGGDYTFGWNACIDEILGETE